MGKTKSETKDDNSPIPVPFQIHPRIFKALGADLVTNDVVAIIELVKNAYDAYATDVAVRFVDASGSQVLEIQDNGTGMDREVIDHAWCTVATPYRRENPLARRPGQDNRRASGEKGLGRLSAARLGSTLEMLTQTEPGKCWKVEVDWDQLANATSISACVAKVSQVQTDIFKSSGTLIRITPLRSMWNDAMIDDLRDNLGRLLPPFETKDDFAIKLSRPGRPDDPINVQPPAFLLEPKYVIRGSVTADGNVSYSYEYDAVKGEGHREIPGTIKWSQIREDSKEPALEKMANPNFGPFTFEIRGWDIAPLDTHEIAERFDLKKTSIRKDIKAYKGISVYRDGVLVLPKSESAKDWLGLDLKRVGRVGHHMSTTQLVGYIEITAAHNPLLEDTSGRERLASTPAAIAFEETVRAIVSTMANERQKDRREAAKEKRVVELFGELNARELIAGVSEVAKEGGTASETLSLIEDFNDKLEKTREEIETRFVYYSRLATVGTIAHMLVHEVRTRTTILGAVIQAITKRLAGSPEGLSLGGKVEMAETALGALDKLAETFAPLANRQFRRRMRSTCVEESVARCLLMIDGDLKAKKIKVVPPRVAVTEVATDPGEFDAILLNLLSNAAYWLGHRGDKDRQIEIAVRHLPDGKRVQVGVHDSGPGVSADDAEKIFWPGVTNKPGGIGMGLTVASELVAEYGGRLALDRKGKLGGASFLFDLPLK